VVEDDKDIAYPALNADGTFVTVNVADTGRGITEDVLPHIFQRFYKKPNNENAQAGAGLGLAIAQRKTDQPGVDADSNQ